MSSSDDLLRAWQEEVFPRIFGLISCCPQCLQDERRYCRKCEAVFCRMCTDNRGEQCSACGTFHTLISRPALASQIDPYGSQLEEWIERTGRTTASEAPLAPGTGRYAVGQRVRARYRDGKEMYPGFIAAVFAGGLYKVAYDDGDEEDRIPEVRIDPLEPLPAAAAADGSAGESFAEGQAVKCNWKGSGQIFLGKIERANANGTYDVTYDDGDHENAVPSSRISALASSLTAEALQPGTRVRAAFKGSAVKYPGFIREAAGADRFAVAFDDGDFDANVHIAAIELE